MSEMVDRIASIAAQLDGYDYGDSDPVNKKYYADFARAAIGVMQVPTAEMCMAGADSADNLSHHGAMWVWQAMIEESKK